MADVAQTFAVNARHREALATAEDRLRESERFHMGVGKVNQALATICQTLERAGIDYAIVGGMALNLHGYARETVDVDLLVTPAGLEAIHDRCVGRGYLPAFAGAHKALRDTQTGVVIEFLTTGEFPGDGRPKPVAFPDPVAVGQNIQNLKVVSLPTLIELKLASGMTQPARRKDIADVQELIRILGLDEGFADQIHAYVRGVFVTLVCELRDETGPGSGAPSKG